MASSKRSVSSGSRTNARTTRMPVICSRSTRLMLSMQLLHLPERRHHLATMSPSTTAATGMRDDEDDRQPDVLAQGHDDADDDA